MKAEAIALRVVESDMVLPGVRFTRTGLKLDGQPTAKDISTIGHVLHVARACHDWCEADHIPLVVALQRQRSARKAKPDSDPHQLEMRVISEYADLTGRDAAILHERDKVGKFFAVADRFADLTFEHHVEAMHACGGDSAKARAWLTAATENKWTVADLRAHIRREVRAVVVGADVQASNGEAIDELPDAELVHMDLAASRLRVELVDCDQAKAQRALRELTNLVALVHELERVAGV